MPNGAHRRKRRRRGSGRSQRDRAGSVRTLVHVAIQWSWAPREVWNEHVAAEGIVSEPEYPVVVYGQAYSGGERVGLVYGPVCCEREAEAYIDTVLSPALNAQLDRTVGYRAWRAESAAGGRKL